MARQLHLEREGGSTMSRPKNLIKCVVWDLDDTLWAGALLEGSVVVRNEICELIKELDKRGILHSVASRNDSKLAEGKLAEIGMLEYFLYPKINWNAKSHSIREISDELNIHTDAMAFVDDQAYEREEVAFQFPDLLCVDSKVAAGLLHRAEFTPRFVTAESAVRRQMYAAEATRRQAADTFAGPPQEFLRGLEMRVEVRRAGRSDLERAEELTARTHQMNTTGRGYSYGQLEKLMESPRHDLLTMRLTDRFGSYGTIGLALIEKAESTWTIKLLLVSCRVANRGVVAAWISYLTRMANCANAGLVAELVPNDRNRPMYVSLIMNGFVYAGRRGQSVYLERDMKVTVERHSHIEVIAAQADLGSSGIYDDTQSSHPE